VCFLHYTRGCGCNGHPAFPAPSIFRGTKFMHDPGAFRAAGSLGCVWIASQWVARMRVLMSDVIACDKREAFAQGSDSDEAIHTYFLALMDCFANARNDGIKTVFRCLNSNRRSGRRSSTPGVA
jgi:hypothetical protein